MQSRSDRRCILSVGTDQNLCFIQYEWGGCMEMFCQIFNILFCKIRCQISAEDDRCIDNKVKIFHGKCQMV